MPIQPEAKCVVEVPRPFVHNDQRQLVRRSCQLASQVLGISGLGNGWHARWAQAAPIRRRVAVAVIRGLEV